MPIHHSIAGGWLGTYAYTGLNNIFMRPVRFEATFRVEDCLVSGHIIEDIFNKMQSSVSGQQVGFRVRFTKTYLSPPPFPFIALPVDYAGTMSEDGLTMSGRWHIGSAHSGVWEARRQWYEEEQPEAVPEGAASTAIMAEPVLLRV